MAGVKGISGALALSFKRKLPTTEDAILDDTDPTQKAPGIARKQNAVAMDATVQCMSDTVDFHHILQSMNKDAEWPTRKAWKTWKIIQENYQPEDSTSSRDLMSALQKIKLKKNANLMKILSDISVVEVRFKKALNEERNIE